MNSSKGCVSGNHVQMMLYTLVLGGLERFCENSWGEVPLCAKMGVLQGFHGFKASFTWLFFVWVCTALFLLFMLQSQDLSFSSLYAKESLARVILGSITFVSGGLGLSFYLHDFLETFFLLPTVCTPSFGFVTHGPLDPFFVLLTILWAGSVWVSLPPLSWMFLETLHSGLLAGEAKKIHAVWATFFLLWSLLWIGCLSVVGLGMDSLLSLYGTDGSHPGFLPLVRGLTWIQFLCTLWFGFGWFSLVCSLLVCFSLPLEWCLKHTHLRPLIASLSLLGFAFVFPLPDVFGALFGLWLGFLLLCEAFVLCGLWILLWKKTFLCTSLLHISQEKLSSKKYIQQES